MRPHGSYKLIGRHRSPAVIQNDDPLHCVNDREMRIVESLRHQIVDGGEKQNLRIRRVLDGPPTIFRIEIDVPEYNYQRTTLLDEDSLEELLAHDEVRHLVSAQLP